MYMCVYIYIYICGSRLADVAQSRTSVRGCVELGDATDLPGFMRGPSSYSAS